MLDGVVLGADAMGEDAFGNPRRVLVDVGEGGDEGFTRQGRGLDAGKRGHWRAPVYDW
ncbi:hypothetical protein D3C75_1162680 [compost metagenome]